MRTLAVSLCLLATAAAAQTPDPTDPARYYPLDVGNVWQYAVSDYGLPPDYGFRVEIIRDTVIEGRSYVIERTQSPRPDGTLGEGYDAFVRFDAERRILVARYNGGEELPYSYSVECPLDAPFGSTLTCNRGNVLVGGGLGVPVVLNGGASIEVAAAKRFGSGDINFVLLAADIGFVHLLVQSAEAYEIHLRYARIRGVEIGAPFPVATEAPPSDAGLELRTRGRSLVIAARDDGPVRVDLFDTLGRRVATLLDARLGAEARTIALPEVASGVYVARAVQGSAHASVRVVVTR